MWLAYRNSGAILGGAINLGLSKSLYQLHLPLRRLTLVYSDYSGKTTGKLNWKVNDS